MKISVFGDLHYSKNHLREPFFEEKREQYYSNFMEALFQQDADYTVSIGDLTNTGMKEEFDGIYEIMSRYNKNNTFILTLGNHDSYASSKSDIEKWVNQPLTQVISCEEVCMIFLDSVREKSIFDWSGYMEKDQLTWLEGVLKENEDKIIVIFCHHPIYDTTLYSTAEKASIVPEVPIADLLAEHTKNQAFYICGHNHADSIVQKDNWTFIQIASVMDQPTIRNIEITEDTFNIDSINMSEEDRQIGNWLGSKMDYFTLEDRGYQGMHNRELSLQFDNTRTKQLSQSQASLQTMEE